jgi:rRNA processing protein Gar1
MKKASLILLLLPIFSFSQLHSDILEQKIVLDTKVELSRSNLIVSVGAITFGFLPVTDDNINIIGGITIAGIFSTPYHLVRHLVYVNKRNKFYEEHNIPRESKRDKNRKNRRTK